MNIQDLDKLLSIEKVFDCVYCSNLLCPPVMLVENKGNMCYSCYVDFKGTDEILALENVVLGEFLKQIEFPCAYKNQGCDKKLKSTYFQEHKEECIYQVISCTYSPQCSWYGQLKHLVSHYKEYHTNRILRNTDDYYKLFDIQDLKECGYILEGSHGFFILAMKITNSDLKILIYDYTQAAEYVEYDFDIIFAINSANMFIRKCKAINNLKSLIEFDDSLVTTVDLDSIRHLVESFSEEKNVEVTIKLINNDANSTLEDCIPDHIECIRCGVYRNTGIYVCENGHNSCYYCKVGHKNTCSKCKTSVIQNVTAKQLVSLVRLPCRWKDQGCVMKINKNSDHELLLCRYSVWDCFLEGCESKFCHPELISHAKNIHKVPCGFANLSGLRIDRNIPTDESYYVIEHNTVFAFKYTNCTSGCAWYIELLEMYDQRYYGFAIEIFSGRPSENKIILTRNLNDIAPTFINLYYQTLNELCASDSEYFDFKVGVFKRNRLVQHGGEVTNGVETEINKTK